jgi:hypothetical protein
MAPLTEASRAWSPEAQEQLKALLAVAADDPRAAANRIEILKNVLLREPLYRAALAEVSTPRAEVGQPLMRFLRLKNPEPQPAPADETLAFTIETLPDAQPGVSWVGAVSLTGEENPVVASLGPSGVHLPGVAGNVACRAWSASPANGPPTPDAVAVADLNYDFRMDLAIVGAGGLCLLRQDAAGQFTDVTAPKLPSTLCAPPPGACGPRISTRRRPRSRVAPRDGHPLVLRNNGDGTFTPRDLCRRHTRAASPGPTSTAKASDAAFLDEAGVVHVFVNLRGGNFRAVTLPAADGRAVAITVAERSSDAVFDLLVLSRDGNITRLSRNARDGSWQGRLSRGSIRLRTGTAARLLAADLDNNGAADLIVAGPATTARVARRAGRLYSPLGTTLALGVEAAADLDGQRTARADRCRPGRHQDAPSAEGRSRIDGRSSVPAPPRPPAINASPRSASAAR